MLPNSFNNYCIKLKNIPVTTILDKKVEMSTFKFLLTLKRGKKKLHYLGLNQWKSIPQEYR